jgi:hypothetical protein
MKSHVPNALLQDMLLTVLMQHLQLLVNKDTIMLMELVKIVQQMLNHVTLEF